ncbi:hypothetical protein [Pseudomonas lini]|uniref:hypothetical protein n=1 Tax=Pseudomonas lini TaxID=163011 RepID=UPI0012E2EE78|nr:hypothetical protein [Pseudomonas lini]
MTWKSALGETSSPLLEGAQYQAPFHESSLTRLLFLWVTGPFNQPKKMPVPPGTDISLTLGGSQTT